MIKKLSVCVAVFVLLSLLAGCAYYPSMFDGYPLQYGFEGSDTSLLVIRGSNWLYGYCDTEGKVVIRPQYHDARPFFEGLAAVKKGKWYGYIDQTGKTVIPFQYYGAADFHNGRAFAGVRRREDGPNTIYASQINRKGELLTEADTTYVRDCSDGMIPVYTDKGCYFLNTEDWSQIPMPELHKYSPAPFFSEEYAVIRAKECFYYMDKTGNNAFEKTYVAAKPFSGGFAASMNSEESLLWGYIDQSGEFVLKPQYKNAFGFGEGLACVQDEQGEWCIIDIHGNRKAIIQAEIEVAKSFSDGLCAVGRMKEVKGYTWDDEQYLWGFIDMTGNLVIDIQYDLVTPFKNGIAQVLVDVFKISYIDKTGKYIWEPK